MEIIVTNISEDFLKILSLLFLVFTFNLQITARAGDLDATFNGNGISIHIPTNSGSGSLGFASAANAVQSDGKIIFAGVEYYSNGSTNDRIFLIRYNTDGSIDDTFGTAGFVRTNIGFFEIVGSLLIQPDGKIVLTGERFSSTTYNDFVALRYNSDGSLDTGFGNSGLAVATVSDFSNERGGTAALQPDGKIVIVGLTDNETQNANNDWAIVRLNSNGQFDTTFDGDGKAVFGFGGNNESAYSVAIQTNGKIVVTGAVSNGTDNNFMTIRLNSGGSLDQSFGANGIVRTMIGNANDSSGEVRIQNDNKIVVSGSTFNGSNSDIAVVRYNSDGSPDNNFGTNGIVTSSFTPTSNEGTYSMAIRQDGKIIISSGLGSSVGLTRFENDGTLDQTFGTNGKVLTVIQSNRSALPYALSLQSDGKIVLSGILFIDSNTTLRYFTARFLGESSQQKTLFDYDGDGKTDISVFRPSSGSWYISNSSNGAFSGSLFGASNDLLAPADYDGDGKTDIAVFRPSSGTWYLQQSTNGFKGVAFGQNGDLPVPADYDGDGKADIAVYRPSTGSWYRLNSSNNQFVGVQFGASEDKPTLGDFDGDGKADLAVFRPSNGAWYRLNSSNDSFFGTQFGFGTDKPVPADFDGDGKTDIAVYRASNGGWYRLNSSDNSFAATIFGASEDQPAPADYDGDGKADVAVFRPSNGTWYLQQSTNGFTASAFGASEDIPTPNAFVR